MSSLPDSISPSSDNEKGKKNMDASRHEKFAMANSYAADLAQSRNAVPPKVQHAKDSPICRDCGETFFHDWEEQRYTCPCPHSIREKEIEFSPFNANAKYKSLQERAEESRRRIREQEEQQQQYNHHHHQANSSNTTSIDPTDKPKIVTERGATSDSGHGYAGGGGGSSNDSNHSFFQTFNPRDKILQERRGYSDHIRTSVKQEPTFIHPLDKELIDKGYQIREVHEVKRQPNSPGVSRNLPAVDPRAPKPYPRYTDDEDPY